MIFYTRVKNQTHYSLEKLIRNRLILVLLAFMILLLGLLHHGLNTITQDFVITRLQHDSESLISALNRTEDDWEIEQSSLPLVYQRALSGHYFILHYKAKSIRSRSLWDHSIQSADLLTGKTTSGVVAGATDQALLYWQQGFTKQGTEFSLWIAEDIAPLQARQMQLKMYVVGLIIAVTSILLFWQRLVLRRGFSQLNKLQSVIVQQHAGNDIPLPQQIPSEVKPLVDAIEQTLSRMGEQMQRSRTSLGNLAHEFKRPLQALQWKIQQESDSIKSGQLDGIYLQLKSLVDRELRRARIAGAPTPGKQFNPKEEIPQVEKLLVRMGDGGIQLNASLPDVALPYDRDDMLELVGNLLDNAWRYARSEVRIDIHKTNSQWLIEVEDDGDGVAESDLEKLVQRGLRLDETDSKNSLGHGLGLSICAAIVQSYNGDLTFHHSTLGGLKVIAAFPYQQPLERSS